MAHSHAVSDYPVELFGIAALAAGVGAAAALLFAPKSGNDTRGMIRERATTMRDQMKRQANDAQEDIGEQIRLQQESLSDMVDKARPRIKKAKDDITE